MLSESEQHRDELQRRQSDTWLQIKNIEVQHRNTTLTAVSSFLALILAGTWWLSGKSAEEKVGPVVERVVVLETNYINMQLNMQKLLKGQEKTYDLLMELKQKK